MRFWFRRSIVLGLLLLAMLAGVPVAPAWAQRGGGGVTFSAPSGAVSKPDATILPSPNYAPRGGVPIDSVVMHTTEVDLAGTLAIFLDSASQVSAHFVIARDGGLYQMVDTNDRAWHATYYNARSIGIEVVGFAGDRGTWNEDNLGTLTELLAWLVTAYPDIPLEHPLGDAWDTAAQAYDQPGIVAHGQVQPWNRTDPGPFFPWQRVLDDTAAIIAAAPEPGSLFALLVTAGLCSVRRH